MTKRVLALLAAVLMVAVAVVVRDRIDDGSGADAGGDDDGGPSAVVVCAAELDAPCRDLADAHPELTVRVEEVTTTERVLADAGFDSADPPFDAWLTLAPFPEMVAEQRARALLPPVLDESTAPVARSPLVIAIWNDRLAVLSGPCNGTISWRCIGDAGGRPWSELGGPAAWGSVKPSHSLPDRTATGLLVLAQASGSYLGRTDFSRNDFDGDAGFRRWFEQLERSIPSFPTPPRTPLDEMLSIGPAVYDLTGTTEAGAGPSIARSRDRDRLSILYPSPATIAEVVIAPVSDADRGARVTDLLQSRETAELLARHGWRVEGQPLATGVDPGVEVPTEPGVPRAGVLEALRAFWLDTIR